MGTQMRHPAAMTATLAFAVAPRQDRVVLRDGSMVVIRPLVTGDVAAIAEWFEGLGPETRYARFLAGITWLDDRTLRDLAQVDHRDHEALTAVTADGHVVGIARYIRVQQRPAAEVAVAVADRWRGRGIASLLLRQIAERAHAAGIETLTALCLASNTAILRLLSRLGPITAAPAEAGVIEVRISLSSQAPPPAGGPGVSRAAVDAQSLVRERRVARAQNDVSDHRAVSAGV